MSYCQQITYIPYSINHCNKFTIEVEGGQKPFNYKWIYPSGLQVKSIDINIYKTGLYRWEVTDYNDITVVGSHLIIFGDDPITLSKNTAIIKYENKEKIITFRKNCNDSYDIVLMRDYVKKEKIITP